jgi:glycosyltransferase involved in cell wall biosynthesis
MIVKNEATVIRRCLESVAGLISHWVIVDTGSTDGTQAIVREHLQRLPGELHERPWRDFAHNRTEALELARPRAEYTLLMDADDVLELPRGYRLPRLTADAYFVDIEHGPARYQRLQIVRNERPWRYVGVLHEYLACEGAGPAGKLPLVYRMHFDGARRRDPKTYARDAEVLERALKTETDRALRSRYTFYLAQSFRDAGERKKALRHYLATAEQGGWADHVYVSLLEAARLTEALKARDRDVIAAYERAAAAAPERAEALHGLARYCREHKLYAEGYGYARAGFKVPAPPGGLFVEPWIYAWGMLDELAVNAYWTGRYQESVDACRALLANPQVPAEHRPRIQANAEYSRQRLGR